MNKYIFTIVIIVFLGKTGNVFSNENIFNVDNISITVNKSKNKEFSFNKAVKIAFDRLIDKILIKKDINKLSSTSLDEIKKLVSHYQLIEENKNINSQKIIFNITFDRDQINKLFYEKNILYADITKLQIIIMPVLIKNDNVYLFSENYFYKNWNEEVDNTKDQVIEYILPLESIESVRLINSNKNNLENIDLNLLKNYEIQNYIYLVINYEKNLTNIYLKANIFNNKLIKNINIKKLEIDETEKMKNIKFILKEQIKEIWKKENLIDVRTPSFLNSKLNLQSKEDLLKVNNLLNKIDLIQNFSVLELNMNYTKITIKYLGNLEKLKKRLNKKGLILKIDGDEFFIELI